MRERHGERRRGDDGVVAEHQLRRRERRVHERAAAGDARGRAAVRDRQRREVQVERRRRGRLVERRDLRIAADAVVGAGRLRAVGAGLVQQREVGDARREQRRREGRVAGRAATEDQVPIAVHLVAAGAVRVAEAGAGDQCHADGAEAELDRVGQRDDGRRRAAGRGRRPGADQRPPAAVELVADVRRRAGVDVDRAEGAERGGEDRRHPGQRDAGRVRHVDVEVDRATQGAAVVRREQRLHGAVVVESAVGDARRQDRRRERHVRGLACRQRQVGVAVHLVAAIAVGVGVAHRDRLQRDADRARRQRERGQRHRGRGVATGGQHAARADQCPRPGVGLVAGSRPGARVDLDGSRGVGGRREIEVEPRDQQRGAGGHVEVEVHGPTGGSAIVRSEGRRQRRLGQEGRRQQRAGEEGQGCMHGEVRGSSPVAPRRQGPAVWRCPLPPGFARNPRIPANWPFRSVRGYTGGPYA